MFKQIGDYIVNVHKIIGTSFRIYSAYEPSSYTGNHSSLMRFNEQVYGEIASSRVGIRKENEKKAYDLILQAFPELKRMNYKKIDGCIEVYN